jgi:alpha-glucoside transport system substrate-binding protein
MRASQRRSLIIATTAATAFALILSGCSAGSATSSAKAGCESYSAYQGHDGTTVEINTTIVSPEAELFQQALQEFQDCTGITINWNGTKDFETQLPVRVAGGTAPDLAVFPQPGLLAAMAATGKLLPAPDAVAKSVDANYSTDWKAYGTVKGTFYAAPLGANVKSFIWYNPSVFKANGWSIPTTWDEVLSLADKIAAGGKIQPFCAGFESGGATGWVGTDWVEEMVLRFEGADTYDKWISHAIPFNDPKIQDALAHAGAILKNPKYIGDVPSIATTSFQNGGAGIVDGTCAMHAQASFIGGILVSNNGATIVDPSDTSNPKGISVFYEPGKTATDKPVEGGGEFVGAFSDRPEVQAVQLYLTTPDFSNKKAALGGWFSANKGLDVANVADPVNKVAVGLLKSASTFRFDASDLMPAAVGAGSFWTEMTAWVAENKSDKDVLDTIEASWPKS